MGFVLLLVILSNKFGNQNQLCHDDEIDDFLILEIASQARNKLENWDAFIFASRGIRALKIGV